jgi:hypothetical protein
MFNSLAEEWKARAIEIMHNVNLPSVQTKENAALVHAALSHGRAQGLYEAANALVRGVVPSAPSPRYEKDLARLATFGPDWDSYGGVPITPEAIAAVRAFISGLQICPRSNGGLQIELAASSGDAVADLAFEPDGSIESGGDSGGVAPAP